ncbi:MAG: Uncharacterized protein G01um101413_295 [Parcubacteria group bacterium Gr01-1014_13]|nr:MAG: Uncharacterized protein G01um101413_295 [Parcubacteria group bacterium Gr01-1014_13]
MNKLKNRLPLLILFFGIAASSLFVSHYVLDIVSWFGVHSGPKISQEAREGIDTEIRYALIQAKELAANTTLRSALHERDIANLLGITADEAHKRNVENIVVTDENGVVLSRTANATKRGDYIFQTTVWGHLVAEGRGVASIEKGRVNPLLIIAASPIKEAGRLIGGIFVSYNLTNDYAKRLTEKYLDPGVELAFYSYEKGVVATSFDDPEMNLRLTSYFNKAFPNSTFTNEGNNSWSNHVQFDGGHYMVRYMNLSGTDHKFVGSVVIFIPCQPGTVAIIIAAILTLLFFISSTLFCHYRRCSINGRNPVSISLLSLLVFTLTFLLSYLNIIRFTTKLTKPPFTIYNSTMAFEPETSIVSKYFEQRIAITVSPGGEAINTVSAVINYDPKAVKIKNIITDKSFCDQNLFLEKNIDEANGKVTISCLAPNPGFAEPKGIVAELVLQPLNDGFIGLRFDPESQVLANDGLGTNVLRQATDGSYQIVDESLTTSTRSLLVFSVTHPNIERWYSKKIIDLSWVAKPDHLYQYALNKITDFVPDKTATTTQRTTRLSVSEDGIYYFHLLETKNNASTALAHFPIRIDLTPPPPPVIRASSQKVATDQIVRFNFENLDTPPSLQSGFFIQFNKGIFLPVQPPLFMPFLFSGNYHVNVRVFDAAGNTNDASTTIEVN